MEAMFQVAFSPKTRFRQVMDRQQKASSKVLIFNCTSTEISIVSMNYKYGSIIQTTILTHCCKRYVCPPGGYLFAVKTFELCEAMEKSKENHNNTITLTIDGVTSESAASATSRLRFDFTPEPVVPPGAEEGTMPSVPSTVPRLESKYIDLLKKYPKYRFKTLPDYSQASILITNAADLKLLFKTMTLFGKRVEITMTPEQVVFRVIPTIFGRATYVMPHHYDMTARVPVKNSATGTSLIYYNEDDLHSECPSILVDHNSIRMNPAHGNYIQQVFRLSTLYNFEKPTTQSNRVVLALTPGHCAILQAKTTNFCFTSQYIGDVFLPPDESALMAARNSLVSEMDQEDEWSLLSSSSSSSSFSLLSSPCFDDPKRGTQDDGSWMDDDDDDDDQDDEDDEDAHNARDAKIGDTRDTRVNKSSRAEIDEGEDSD